MSDKPPIPEDLRELYEQFAERSGDEPIADVLAGCEARSLIERVGRAEASYWQLFQSAIDQSRSLQAEVERYREALEKCEYAHWVYREETACWRFTCPECSAWKREDGQHEHSEQCSIGKLLGRTRALSQEGG